MLHTKSDTGMITKPEEASVEFGILLNKILEVLMKNKDKNLQLLKSICSTITIKNDSKVSIFSSEELKRIMACSDIQYLFLVELRNYWRWDELSVLSIIVSSLRSKKCEALLDQFEEKIDARIKLFEIYEQCVQKNDFPTGFHKMVAITRKSFSNVTKKEYKILKDFIARNCGVEPYAISPCIKVSSSSLWLEWYIPEAAVAYMISIASVNKQMFIDHDFIYLEITSTVILDERDTVS